MSVSINGGSSGFDPSLYSVVECLVGSVTPVGVLTTYTPLLDITGKGYVKNAAAISNGGCRVRVTVDGVTTVHNSTGGGSVVGLVNKDTISIDGGSAQALVGGYGFCGISMNNAGKYPNTDLAKNTTIIPQPIFFEQDLLVEISSSSTIMLYYEVDYAVM